jgi:hypothetical protein
MKKCKECNTVKNENDFGSYTSKGNKYKRKVCKECRNTKARNSRDDRTRWLDRELYKKKKQQNPSKLAEYYRDQSLRQKYGITLEEYWKMCDLQNNQCVICYENPFYSAHHKDLVVDHNHKTGEVRGLICQGCNSALGHAKDSVSVLNNMVTYLNERGSYGE